MAKSHDVITLLNTTNEDFVFYYDKSSGNPPYVMPAGKPSRFPRFLANHGLKHFIDHLINLKGGNTNDKILRRELANEVVVSEETFQREVEPTEAEKLKATVDELNKPSELESVLSRYRKKKSPKVTEIPVKKEVAPEPKEEPEEFEGLEKETKVTPKVKPKPVVEKRTETKARYPSRSELMEHVKDKMGITVDAKLKSKFDKMNIPTLVKELDYPLKGE